ncbi:MAG TPA: TPM domain-containing protein, partial [Thermoanaerobaculia bacterium]|nr:TPM domain-containing protein [Thermoanaerobaculia bacterium]
MNIRRSAIAFVAIALLASAALALDIPPKPTQWVNDYNANLLNASQIQQLNEKLEGFYKKTGVQFLILIFPSLEGEDDLGYTNKVANVWKVKDDKALMLFVFA